MPTVIVEYTDDIMRSERGVLLNSHWSDAFGCWILLVSSENGKLQTIRSDTLGLVSMWIDDGHSIVLEDDDTDEDENKKL